MTISLVSEPLRALHLFLGFQLSDESKQVLRLLPVVQFNSVKQLGPYRHVVFCKHQLELLVIHYNRFKSVPAHFSISLKTYNRGISIVALSLGSVDESYECS